MLEPDNETFNQAFDQCMVIARGHLEKFGEFYPFGCYVDRNGQFVITGGYTGEEHPSVVDTLALLDTDLKRALADGEAQVTFLTVNVNIPEIWETPYRDGVRVTVTSADYSALIYTPYLLKNPGFFRRRRTVSFSEGFLVEPDEQ